MSRSDSENEAKSPEIINLGDVRFHTNTKELETLAGEPIQLRNQSAEVLAYLASHRGQLVSKDDLIEAVWAETFVTDDSLVQCIGDIRKALNDTDRRIVETVPRKGYRLNVVAVKAAATSTPPVRWASSLALVAALVVAVIAWAVLSPTAPPHGDTKPRIAVLAFQDFSAGDDVGYLSDAIAEGIITELARFKQIEVVARNSSFHYRGTNTDVRQIGNELGAHYVLEGSQQKSGQKLRVTIQLIGTHDGTHLWAHTYEQDIGDLFTVQDKIIKTVADRIGFRIERPVPGSDPDRVTALHLHLVNIANIRDNFSEQAVAENIERDFQAIEIDPDAPYAYIGLAMGHRSAAVFGWLEMDPDVAIDKALEYALKALELAPHNPDVHYALARIYTETDDRDKAMAAYDKAIDLNPIASNYLVGSTTPLLYVGETEKAIERLNRAKGIDPFHPAWYHWQMGWALWETGDCEGALAAMLRMEKIRKGAHRMLAGIYACLGDVENAQKACEVFYEDSDEPTISEQREEWQDIWTAPGSLDRWLKHMRIAGMKE